MRTPTTDPTAGRTARAVALDPTKARPIVDPTDPRYGVPTSQTSPTPGATSRIADPTDPACGDVAE